jgi:tetratricopeptide (TPR) repeat protein
VNRGFILLVSGLLIVSQAEAAAGEKPWVEVGSPHFRVLTDGSQAQARHVANEFEQLRYVFVDQFPTFRVESGAPLLVFAARDEETAKALEPRRWKMKGAKPAGLFHHGWEKQYVMVRLDTWGQGAHEVVYHEYTHSILHLNAHWLPVWLDEGMAEFYAYTQFQEHEIYVGAPTERYRTLLAKPLLPVENLITTGYLSPYYRDEDTQQMFYAESWALVHFLTFGPGMENGKRLNQFFRAIEQGTEQKKAFQQVFGDFKEIDKRLSEYTRKFTFRAAKLPSPPKIEDKQFSSHALSVAETKAELAGFHLWTHDLESARPLVEQALKGDPKLALAHEEKGFLLFADGNDTAALDEFSQASALDGALYLSLFAKAMLSPIANSDGPADQTALNDILLQVLHLNPQFAPAYIQLARLDLRQDDLKSALAVSRKAEELEPSRAGYHLMSGQILLRMGRGADSAAFAKFVADRWFGADHDEAVELWNSVAPDQRPAAEPLAEMIPKETQTVSGAVHSVRCAEPATWALVLNHDHQLLTFHRKGGFEAGFSDTIWYGEDHFTLCHHLEGKRAIVRYRPASDESYAGDVAELEIRDDLPSPVKSATEKIAVPVKPKNSP